jgi:hypothetical protein
LICAPSHSKTIEFRKVIGHGVETTLLFGKIRKVLRTTLIVIFPFIPWFLHAWINMTTAI